MIRSCKLIFASLVLVTGAAVAADPVAQPLTDSIEETVNINTADAPTLARALKGVGDSRAEAIVRYREEHGQFIDIYELANVKGVGEHTVDMNADRITLKD